MQTPFHPAGSLAAVYPGFMATVTQATSSGARKLIKGSQSRLEGPSAGAGQLLPTHLNTCNQAALGAR
jgi:hypothetical protein